MSGSEEQAVSLDLVHSLVTRTIALAGTSIAIFTFVLFFLYPRYASKEVDPALFQVTLSIIVLVIFAFAFSGTYYYGVLGVREMARRRTFFRKGNYLFIVGLVFVTVEPAAILFTVKVYVVGLLALALYFWFVYFLLRHHEEFPR